MDQNSVEELDVIDEEDGEIDTGEETNCPDEELDTSSVADSLRSEIEKVNKTMEVVNRHFDILTEAIEKCRGTRFEGTKSEVSCSEEVNTVRSAEKTKSLCCYEEKNINNRFMAEVEKAKEIGMDFMRDVYPELEMVANGDFSTVNISDTIGLLRITEEKLLVMASHLSDIGGLLHQVSGSLQTYGANNDIDKTNDKIDPAKSMSEEPAIAKSEHSIENNSKSTMMICDTCSIAFRTESLYAKHVSRAH